MWWIITFVIAVVAYEMGRWKGVHEGLDAATKEVDAFLQRISRKDDK